MTYSTLAAALNVACQSELLLNIPQWRNIIYFYFGSPNYNEATLVNTAVQLWSNKTRETKHNRNLKKCTYFDLGGSKTLVEMIMKFT